MKRTFLFALGIILNLSGFAYDFEVDGIFYNITSIEEKTVEVTYSTDLNYQQNYIVIPAEVTWNNYVFSVKGIGRNAFDSGNYPNKVDTIIISKGIEYIGELAFQCQRLKKIQIPNTVKTIGSNAFSPGNERNITTDWYVEDYEWLCTIGHYFSYPHVKDIYVDNKKIDGDFIIPEGVPYISSCFWGCDWIKTLSIPSTVSNISGSFWRCTNLESVEIKEGVKNLYGQFDGCTNLKSVTLPNSLVSIGGYVFNNCPALIDIQSFITEPFPTDGFTNGQYLNATLTVPHGTKAKYLAVDGWKNFVNIQERDGVSYTIDLSIVGNGTLSINGETLGDFIIADENSDISIECIPAEGYKLTKVILDDVEVTSSVKNNVISLDNITSNHRLEVSFDEMPVSLTIQHANNGLLKQYVQRGSSISFALIPAEGWKINTVTYNGYDVTSELNSENEFTTPAIYNDAALSVSFESTQSAVNSARVSNAKVYASNGQIIVAGVESGNMISVYDESGKVIAQTITRSKEHRLSIQSKGIYIVKVEGKTVKVSL